MGGRDRYCPKDFEISTDFQFSHQSEAHDHTISPWTYSCLPKKKS